MTFRNVLMFNKMREFLRITLVCVCAVLLVGDGWCAEDVVSSEVTVESEPISTRSDDADQRRDRQSTLLPGKVNHTFVYDNW